MLTFSSSKICWALMIALRAIVVSSVEPASAISSSNRELLNPYRFLYHILFIESSQSPNIYLADRKDESLRIREGFHQ